MKKAKLYISHFIQVVDMAITRGELNPEIRFQFGLNEEERKLPNLNTEEELIETGKKLSDGERNRKLKGLAPITNPTIAVVQVHYDKFFDAYNNQKGLKRRSGIAQENLAELREKTDAVIQQIWNEVEEKFDDLPEEIRREKSAEYGVVYVFRKNELDGLNLFHSQRAERLG
jgi:hypothetical protein